MAYNITLTDGSAAPGSPIADGDLDTDTSMVLVGKNYAGYGAFLNQNFVRLLENGANTTAPGAPLTGQLWWDKSNNVMKVYNGTTFKTISAATASSTTPTSNVTGDLWFDTTNQQLKVYNGSSFILVGPASSSGQGTSGAIVTTITDNVAVDHVVVQLYVNNTIVAMVSKDEDFVPQVAITGFATISPGIQLSSTVANVAFTGTATDSDKLGGVAASGYLSATANDTTTGTLGILNDTGLTVGLDQDAKISVTTATSAVNIQNQTEDANLNIIVNDGGSNTTVLTFVGSTGNVLPGANNTVALGSTTSQFADIYAVNFNGTASSALYADVAERFAADELLEPGTVVELGGTAEVTMANQELSENVFGVISTRAAYLMNSGAGSNDTHPPVAMTGRVPVRVIGTVKKGDRLVSAGNGLARSARPGEATAFNVIGRSLEDRYETSQGMVEAIVTIK